QRTSKPRLWPFSIGVDQPCLVEQFLGAHRIIRVPWNIVRGRPVRGREAPKGKGSVASVLAFDDGLAIQSGCNRASNIDSTQWWRFKVETKVQGGNAGTGLYRESPITKKEGHQEWRNCVQGQIPCSAEKAKGAGVVIPHDDQIRVTKGCL